MTFRDGGAVDEAEGATSGHLAYPRPACPAGQGVQET
jgi:hypothetical protein